jgi:uncharacterized repeat protein (TIGR01451 family)
MGISTVLAKVIERTGAWVAIAVAAACASLFVTAEPAVAATPLTGWGIESVHAPTSLPPGGFGEYAFSVYNNGAAASSGTITVTDQLPAGVTTGETPSGVGWTCAPNSAGQQVFTCTSSQVVNPDGVATPIHVAVEVPAVAEGTVLSNKVSVSGGGAPESASDSEQATVSATPAPFGIQSLNAQEYGEGGELYNQAGGHPFAATATWRYNTDAGKSFFEPARNPEPLKDVEVELPPGIIGNPSATPRCFSFGHCPLGSQIGMIYLSVQGFSNIAGGLEGLPIFNMVPPAGMAAQFKFQALAPIVTIDARVRSNGNYGLTAYSDEISENYAINGARVTFWGTPAAHSHDAERRPQVSPVPQSHPSGAAEIPFLSNPTDCTAEAAEPPVTTLKSDSWRHPGAFAETTWTAPAMTNCDLLSFEPQIAFAPETTQAGQPAGFGFHVHIPQNEVTGGLATPELKDTTVTLPAGMGVSPSATGGLTACSESEIALQSVAPGECPLSSQVATVAIWTPLLTTQPTLRLTGVREGEMECASGSWSGSEAGHPFRYQWLRDGVAIAGAEGTVYLPVSADEGKAIQCEVTATNAGGSTAAVSTNEVISPYPTSLPPEIALLPKLEGTASTGVTDTCSTGSWGNAPTGYAYRWLRDGAPIAGAETGTYLLGAADEGQTVQCQVTASNTGGSAVALSLASVVGRPATVPPLIEPPLKGRVYVAEPECSPCSATDVAEGKLVGLYLEAAGEGVRVKLPGHISVNPSNGQLTAHFGENPQLPFEELQLNFKNGPRAPLAVPQTCGTYTTTTDLQPWSAPDPLDATPTSSFNADWDGHGGACPASLPFSPTFVAGTSSPAADGHSNFTATFERPRREHESEERSEQDFAGIQVHTPPGLLGKLTGVPLCGEPQAAQGTCGAASQIGTTTIATGPGAHPLHLQGQVYLTTGYKGAPFGMSIVVPAEAGPFRLAGTTGRGTVVVRAAITIDPETAALTITADPLPQIVDGVILRLQEANVEINRPDFIVNATNCTQQSITATITGAQGAKQELSDPYAASGCANLSFNPSFAVSTQAKTSKSRGASLTVNVASPTAVGEANIKMVKVELPKQLPSRLTTLQKACLAATFESNPAACPSASVVGVVKALTPILPVPLEGPVYFVSHGGEAFPSLIVVLQGDGVRINLVGSTFISPGGITSSTFKTVPDAPVTSFELTLPEGPYSALAANGNLCASKLAMPTTMEGQNGKVIKQSSKITITGCPKTRPAVAVTGSRVKGDALLVTVKSSAEGRVQISGIGLRTTTKNVKAGSHQIKVALSKQGKADKRRHAKVRLRVSLTVGKQAAAKTTSVKL